MATLDTALAFARTQSQTDDNGLTDAKGIIFANEALLDIHRQMITSGIDASQLQESYRSGTIDTGTYLYPTDMWFLKSIEVNYANTTAQDYKRAEQIDISNLVGNVSVGWLRSNQDTFFPQFDDRGDYFELFPTPTGANNVTDMMRITYFLEPTEYTATSDTISYPISLDYRMLGWRLAANYQYALGEMAKGDAFYAKYQEKLTDVINNLSRGSQQPMEAKTIGWTGWNF